jgi:ABC-type sulfate/molybdate transport systems ATPase subunit
MYSVAKKQGKDKVEEEAEAGDRGSGREEVDSERRAAGGDSERDHLTIPAGQFVAILGASGSGKSTLLGLLAGLDTPSSGEIWLDGVPIHNLAEAELAAVRGEKIGFVFQSYQLIRDADGSGKCAAAL